MPSRFNLKAVVSKTTSRAAQHVSQNALGNPIEIPGAGQPASNAVAVLAATPSLEVRRRWSRALRPRFAVHEVAGSKELDRVLAGLKPAVLLLDLGIRKVHGVAGLPWLRRLSASTKIVSFASQPDDQEAILALKAGARGYCDRNIPPAQLIKAVERIRQGEVWVGRSVIGALLDELTALNEQHYGESSLFKGVHARTGASRVGARMYRVDGLTSREFEIASLVCAGSSNREIASSLHLSEKTVKSRLTTIFRKLGISSRLQLALILSRRPRDSK